MDLALSAEHQDLAAAAHDAFAAGLPAPRTDGSVTGLGKGDDRAVELKSKTGATVRAVGSGFLRGLGGDGFHPGASGVLRVNRRPG